MEYLRIPIQPASNEVYIGFAYYHTVLPGLSNYTLLSFTYNEQLALALVMSNTGQIYFRRFMTNLTPDSGANVLAVDTWYYIEVKVVKTQSASAGDLQIWVDGVQWVTIDVGQDSMYSALDISTDCITFTGYTVQTRLFDDLYVCDASGSVNNTFLGPIKVATLYPDGNGNSNQFLGSDADSTDNYLHVDEEQSDSDTSYVESNTLNHIDQYTFEDMPSGAGQIHGVELNVVSSSNPNQGGLPQEGTEVARVGGTDYLGDAHIVSGDFFHHSTIWETNPDDAAAWEVADIDAAEFGVKITA